MAREGKMAICLYHGRLEYGKAWTGKVHSRTRSEKSESVQVYNRSRARHCLEDI